MPMLPVDATTVILASNYNPAIVSKEWLLQKKIFTETIGNFVHTPPFSLVENENFHLTVDERRFQIAVKRVTQDRLSAMTKIAARFVQTLPETPYKALGINYQFDVASEQCDLNKIISPKSERIRELFAEEFELGATVRFQFRDFVTTVTMQPDFARQRNFRVAFNFHSDIPSVNELKKRLTLQDALLSKAQDIIEGLTKNGESPK